MEHHSVGEERWFAIRVKPQREKLTGVALRNKGYEEFLPLYKSKRLWSDRVKEIELPLFPGYVFCRFNAEFRLPILTTPGVVHIVGTGRTLVPIEDDEIAALQHIAQSGYDVEPWRYLQVGQLVRIMSGSLSGLEGILLEHKGGHRLVVSITLLQRSVSVEIDHRCVAPVTPMGRPMSTDLVPGFARRAGCVRYA